MTAIGANYGQALYSLAVEEGQAAQILDQLQVLQKSFSEEPSFIRLLSAANISKAERCQILEDSFRDRVHPYVLNFLKILTEKGHIRQFESCVKTYRQQHYADQNILEVLAVTAVEMTEDQQQRLKEKLATITGKSIDLICRVDGACLGGVRLDYDGKRLDGTVKNRLEDIGKMLKNTVL